MFLGHVVVVMAEFVHEHMEEHESPGLGFTEAADDVFFPDVIRQTNAVKDGAVTFEVRMVHANPEVFVPGVEFNRGRVVPLIELQAGIVAWVRRSQDDTFQALRELVPVRNQVDEGVKIPLGKNVTVTRSGRLAVDHGLAATGQLAPVFPLDLAIHDLGGCSALHGTILILEDWKRESPEPRATNA